MLSLFVWLIVICLVIAVAYWIIQQIPLPAPMNMIVRVLFGLVCLVVLLYFVTGALGPPNFHRLN